MYAFARDGGIPGHKFFNYVSPTWKSPIRTGSIAFSYLLHCVLLTTLAFVVWLPVWLACTLSFILGLPSLGSSVAFAAATSIATIGLYISYGESPLKLLIFGALLVDMVICRRLGFY